MPDRASSSSPLTKPLLAGLGAAVLGAGGLGLLALLGGAEPEPVSARIALPAPETIELAVAPTGPAPVDLGADASEDVALPGVSDTEAALSPVPPDVPSSDPADAERRLARSAPPAPLQGFFEPGPGGPLPIIHADGRRPSQVYAKAFDGDFDAPTLAVVVGGLGLNAALTEAAIETLPSSVTLSFVPYSDDLQGWINRARADGHEVLIELPMEPFDYPNNDPGPHTLLAEASPAENRRRLEWLLSRASGYFGVTNYLGARFGTEQAAMASVFAEVERRGLDLLHDGAGRRSTLDAAASASGAHLAVADRVVDGDPDPRAIDRKLLELEALALQNGSALGSGFAYPATVDSVAAWVDGLDARGYQLAPASFLVRKRRAQDQAAGDGGRGA
ncbi:MAG: divergent polysaccharide deacetylase family protein [Pseudomonadota bacterium]